MTANMVSERAPQNTRPGRRVADRLREALVFGGATTVALLHALDDAFVHRQPGVGLGQHALAAAGPCASSPSRYACSSSSN
jgi:hypothetical protein